MSPPKSAHSSIEVDSGEVSDSGISDLDSLYSDPDTASMTETLASKWTKYKFQHGRRYAAHDKEGQIVPNDEQHQDHLDVMHEVYSRAKSLLGGELLLAPISENPHRIMDVGTGTGIWAMQCADRYPSAAVVGFDISPIQPEWVPPNCSFEVNDFNEASWSYSPNSFDVVHVRACHSNVDDWHKFIKNAFKVVKPGGWLEVCGEVAEMRCDDGTLPEDSPLHLWIKCAKEGTDKVGKPMRYDEIIEDCYKEAGFDMATFKSNFTKVPVGTWPKDKQLKELGGYNLVGLFQGLEGYMMALYTGLLGWTEDDTRKHMDDVLKALKNKKQHTYFRFQCHYAQKPMVAASSS